jgi:signal transduction histidine kinase
MRLRRGLPRWTVRLRLALLYGCLFMLAGATFLGLLYIFIEHSPPVSVGSGFSVIGYDWTATVRPQAQSTSQPRPILTDGQHLSNVAVGRSLFQSGAVIIYRLPDLTPLISESALALALAAAVSGGLGWFAAGRALRPVRVMTASARRISDRNLAERLRLPGPADELKELGDTFDDLLSRLQEAFESQRRFVANASHELRTPLAAERTILEVAVADPAATADSLREACARALEVERQQERLIESLLMLALSHRGLVRAERLDLKEIAARVLVAVDSRRAEAGLDVDSMLDHAAAAGDPALLDRLVCNLVDNAIRHNVAAGWLRVETWTGADASHLRVVNTGPTVESSQVAVLFEPFRRAGEQRVGAEGVGLGLSIVAAVTEAHGGTVEARARPEGGLEIEVMLPVNGVAAAKAELGQAGHS